MIASTQITDTETFSLIAVLVFKLLSHKVLFINRKGRNCLKVENLFQVLPVVRKIKRSRKAELFGKFNFFETFSIFIRIFLKISN